MTTVLNSFMRVMDVVNVGIRWILAAMMLAMSVLIGWQVFARFVIGDSLSFSEEISRFLMVWLVLLGSAYAARNGRLMKVDILEHILPGKGKKVAVIVSGLLSIVFYLLLVVFGFMIVEAVSYQNTPATRITMSIPMAALPVGGVFLVLNTLYHLSAVVLGRHEESEIDELLDDAREEAEGIDVNKLVDGHAATAASSDPAPKKDGDR